MHQKVVQIVREEMDAIGGQEMLCPVLTPAELWQRTGRYDIPEVFKLEDRAGRPFVLPMTHEETFTFHASEIQSYRELPQILYHFQTKDRDEPRSRGGLLRLREFIMKDAYSFDRDEEGLDRSFRLQAGAYERIFERCGLEFFAVQAESGMMGGSESIDYLAPSGAGENTLVTCERGDYAADLEIALGIPRAPTFPEALDRPRRSRRRGSRRSKPWPASSASTRPPPRRRCRSRPATERVVLGLVRGDDRLDEAKLAAALGAEHRPATMRRSARRSAPIPARSARSASPATIVADEALREGQFVAGANRTGWHLRGVEAGRDFEPRFADIRESRRRATPARAAAARCASRPRSRSATSSSSGPATRCRSAPSTSTSTAGSSRS